MEEEREPVEKMIDKYKILQIIGKGTYGEVFKALDVEEKEIVAIKKTISKLDCDGIPSSALREISLLREISHENIVVLKDVVIEDNVLYLIFEYSDSDLKKYIDSKANQPIDPIQIKKIVYQILRGTATCHSHRIIHRDLKPQNILISKKEQVQIADFGLARAFCMPIPSYTKEVVTLWYRPPEILLGAVDYCTPVDIWSIGCILFELITSTSLFQGDSEIGQIFKIFQVLGTPSEVEWPGIKDLVNFRPTFPKFKAQKLEDVINNIMRKQITNYDVDIAAVDLLYRLLCFDPIKRITARSAMAHPYFNDVRGLYRETTI